MLHLHTPNLIHAIINMGIKESKITYFDGSYYEGAVNAQGREHGDGRITYANGDSLRGSFVDGECTSAYVQKRNGQTYDGQMRDLRYHGKGTLKRKNQIWVGLFRSGLFLRGSITFEDGSFYQGAVQKGCKAGKGYLRTPEGATYNGYFRNDRFEGNGYLIMKDGSNYRGEFRNGEYEGKGTLTKLENGRKVFQYKGNFVAGYFDGFGEVTYENGNHFEGEFRNGKKNGHGVFRYQNGDIYEGGFRDDIKEDTQCRITKANGTTYVGGIKNGQYHGQGRIEKQDGEYYQGGFNQGAKEGRGVLKTTQYLYQGSFKNDEKHGAAKVLFYNDSHDIFEGSFDQGRRHGKCILTGERQYVEETYNQGVKEGLYLKRIKATESVPEYEEKGVYVNDERHGPITIRKGNEVATYRFENGVRGEEISAWQQ